MSDELEKEIDAAVDAMRNALDGVYGRRTLAMRCANYIEEMSRDDNDFELLFLTAIRSPQTAGVAMEKIAEKHLRAFVTDNLSLIEEVYGLGKFAEKEQEDE